MESVVSYPDRGNFGKNSYRGNCSGKIIQDLIEQFKVSEITDCMVGSGTTEDVANAMGIEGHFFDLNRGFDLMHMEIPVKSEFIFWHPPYWDIIKYAGSQYDSGKIQSKFGFNPEDFDLSRPMSWEQFVKEMNYCCVKQFASLEKGGRMAVLMGDIKKNRQLYSMIAEIAKPGTLEQIVIKMQHNCVSDGRQYAGKFIPIVHEYLMIVRKDGGLVYPVLTTTRSEFDMRDIQSSSWRDVIIEVMDSMGGSANLESLYKKIDGHRKAKNNPNWKAKIRQVVQDSRYFTHIGTGVYALA